MNQMYLFYYSRTNDMADAEKVLEALVASRYLEKADLQTRLRMLAQTQLPVEGLRQGHPVRQRDIKEGETNDDVYTIVDQAYYLKGDYTGALKSINAHMDVAPRGRRHRARALLKLESEYLHQAQ
jgi:hypothetical protein